MYVKNKVPRKGKKQNRKIIVVYRRQNNLEEAQLHIPDIKQSRHKTTQICLQNISPKNIRFSRNK